MHRYLYLFLSPIYVIWRVVLYVGQYVLIYGTSSEPIAYLSARMPWREACPHQSALLAPILFVRW